MASSPILRKAGILECFHIVRHYLELDSCVVVGAKFASLDGLNLTPETLFPALRVVLLKHPALCVTVEDEDGKPAFVRLDNVDLSHVVRFSDADDVELAVQRQLSTRFDTSSRVPLWRLEVLGDRTVLFAFHHGIGDGLSGVAVQLALLDALQKAQPHSDSSVVEVPKTIELLPPLEVATNIRPSVFKVLSTVLGLFLPASFTRAHSAWTCNPVPATIPRLEPRLKLVTFGSTEMTAFTKVCRSHNATVTSAFYVLAVATLSQIVPPASKQHKKLCVTVAISLRGPANTPADCMCDYVSAHKSYPAINKKFNWSTAASYASELKKQRLAVRQEAGLLHLVFGDYIGFFKGQLGRKRGATFEISNAGRVQPSEGRWRVEDMVFAQCNVTVGSAISLSVIGDPTGAVTIAFTWAETAVDSVLVEAFAAQFFEGFQALAYP
uniref:Alcohol acetyltransferase n=1 Tax=Mycena chlorophos TaxID=658473 RepID=A0ABQ0M0M1_MYCCL|nr:predicted protein [Mycena chlorophos]